MGSSSKKKKDKKKDFQKPKLKVGKARPKPTNHTDTSFKSKAIILKQSSLNTTAPSSSSQFTHHLSLLSSRSESQRKESLSYLTSAISTRPVGAPLQLSVGNILPKILPLILDGSNGVRTQLVKLLRSLRPNEVEGQVEKMLPYIRAGMTHLAADIRRSSLDIIHWALDADPDDFVSSPGGWVKTVKYFLIMLGWSTEAKTPGWSSTQSSGAGAQDANLVKCLTALSSFLEAGLVPSEADLAPAPSRWTFPLLDVHRHMLPQRPNAFRSLNLFGPPRDEESEGYEDRGARQRIFADRFQSTLEERLRDTKRQGGEVGRAAARAEKVVVEGMSDFEGGIV